MGEMGSGGEGQLLECSPGSYVDVGFCKKSGRGYCLEIMVHLTRTVLSVTLMLNKPHLTCMYVLALYIMSLDMYTMVCIYITIRS